MIIKKEGMLAALFLFSVTMGGFTQASASTESVLTPGAQLIAGDLSKNEFYILGQNDAPRTVASNPPLQRIKTTDNQPIKRVENEPSQIKVANAVKKNVIMPLHAVREINRPLQKSASSKWRKQYLAIKHTKRIATYVRHHAKAGKNRRVTKFVLIKHKHPALSKHMVAKSTPHKSYRTIIKSAAMKKIKAKMAAKNTGKISAALLKKKKTSIIRVGRLESRKR